MVTSQSNARNDTEWKGVVWRRASSQEGAEVETLIFLAFLEAGDASPRPCVSAREAQRDVTAADPAGDLVDHARVLVAGRAVVQQHVVLLEAALLELVAKRLEIFDGHARIVSCYLSDRDPMALPSTLRRFEIALADADRGVYEQLDWRVPQHPSESERYLIARLIARCLEHAEGVEFGPGLSTDDEPAIVQKNLRGELVAWIEVGAPSPERLHKACKRAARVAVYAWKLPEAQAAAIAEFGVHRAAELALYALPPALLDAAAATLDRNNHWDLSITGGAIYLTVGDTLCEGTVERIAVIA
jgi:uncharacterized protein YaeQ